MIVHELARFTKNANYNHLSEEAIRQVKIRILDSLGTAIGALNGKPIQSIKKMNEDLGGNRQASLIGGGKTSLERAALYNSALVRYLDFNDSYLAKGETCHPSDNIASILAAGEFADIDGKELLTAIAVAYQIQCRLSDEAPVRDKGFDHTTHGSYSVAAGVAKALNLNEEKTANAIAIAGTALNALRVTRTGELSNWKGLAFPHTAFGATHAVLLAKYGITGPPAVFEGNKGFIDSIAGEFEIDWQNEDLEKVTQTIIKRYNAEIHSQSSIEGILELQKEKGFAASAIESIDLEIFDVAYNIIGGGEEGDKTIVRKKEEADHSLQYMLSAALLDGQVMPNQYKTDRITRGDIQSLLKKINVKPNKEYSDRFPEEMPVKMDVHLNSKETFTIEKTDYEGFKSRPMSWETVTAKFNLLAESFMEREEREKLLEIIFSLENHSVKELMESIVINKKETTSIA